ncbi:hypothetical protein ACFWNK_21830 [Streptomyces sp. NPDC058417]|uniref:hypothetical protein n=1 Tax=unclassified Streptomyces TaxID=2593676 RepID=UPI003669A316
MIEFEIPKHSLGGPGMTDLCQPKGRGSGPDVEHANTCFEYVFRVNGTLLRDGDDLSTDATPRGSRFMAGHLVEVLAQQIEELAPPIEKAEPWAVRNDQVDRLNYWASGIVDPTLHGDEEPPCSQLGCTRHSRYAVHAVTLPKVVGAPEHDAMLCGEYLEELCGRMDIKITSQGRVF